MDPNQCNETAIRLRDSCFANPGNPDGDALNALLTAATDSDRLIAANAARALIRVVVEELSDRFDPALTDAYCEIFTKAISHTLPAFSDRFLRQRYQGLCESPVRPLGNLKAGTPSDIFVLSRITLGADIAVSSVFLKAFSTRFPEANLWFAGPAKNYSLFAGMPRIRHWPIEYPRGGTLAERFAVADSLHGAFDDGNTWLVDPDSRISQLGLLPIAPLTSTFYFESRASAPESDASLSALASAWCSQHLGLEEVLPALAVVADDLSTIPPLGHVESSHPICVSLGVGNNETKRLSADFEWKLLRALASTGRPLWIDAGAGGEEAAAVQNAIEKAQLPERNTTVLNGSFAAFCVAMRQSALYVGYDSAGQHAAAAMGIPAITLFKGFANERMFLRWQPRGPAQSQVIRVDVNTSEEDVLEDLKRDVAQIL